MIRIACTTLEKRIKAGRVSKSGLDFIGNPADVTSDCLKAVIDYVGVGGSHVVTANGEPVCEIEIHALKSEVKEQAAVDKDSSFSRGEVLDLFLRATETINFPRTRNKAALLSIIADCAAMLSKVDATLQSQPQQVNK